MTDYSNFMPFEQIPDWEKRLERQDAFWDCEIIDRPVVYISVPREKPLAPVPAKKNWSSHRDYWMDFTYRAEKLRSDILNQEYSGDALPKVIPNLGPEVFSAYFGCEMEYGETTSWAIPNIHDWSDVSHIKFSEDNFYWKKTIEYTNMLLEAGKGLFHVGVSDLHPGGDGIAAFRDPMDLNIDMIDHPDEIKRLLEFLEPEFFRIFDFYYNKLRDANQLCTWWMPIVSSRKYHVPSNDFSAMISPEMFEEFFLPGIRRECQYFEASIYHLDGPEALRHLDMLLDIPELNAIQWVYGAGQGRASDWLQIYQRCQAANKGIQLHIEPDELNVMMENLKPEGVWMMILGVNSRDEAEALIKKIETWR